MSSNPSIQSCEIERINYCSLQDPKSIQNWSGTTFFIGKMLEKFVKNVEQYSSFKATHSIPIKIRYKLSKLLRKNFYYDHTNSYTKQYGRQLQKRLKGNNGIVFTINSQLIARADISNKIVLYQDATLASIYGYYEYFSDLAWYEKKEVLLNEKKALERADLLLFASDWVAEHSIAYYQLPREKVRVVPFGANLEETPSRSEFESALIQKQFSILKLLFVGYDFDRKGGAMAVKIAEYLNEHGVPVELTLVGVSDFESRQLPDFVINGGVLQKNIPEEAAELANHFNQAHFFVMPSKRECYGLVYAEAFAYGLPVLAIRTGGVPTIVQHDLNGWLFELSSLVEDYATVLISLKQDPDRYMQMARSARDSFEAKLNWDIAGQSIACLLKEIES